MNYYKTGSRRNVQEKTALTIIPGQTTKEEIFLALGAPDEVSPDGSQAIYNWTKVKAVMGGEGAAMEIDQKASLNITFDERGVVVHREVKQNFWVPW